MAATVAAGIDDLVINEDDKTTIRKHIIDDPSNKWVKTILCGQCAANNNLNSTFCHYCSRRLDRARARAHKHIQRGVAVTKRSWRNFALHVVCRRIEFIAVVKPNCMPFAVLQ